MKIKWVQMIKKIYMIVIKTLTFLFKGELTNNVTYLLSFPDNNDHLIEELIDSEFINHLTIIYKRELAEEAQFYQKKGIEIIELNHFSFYFIGLKRLIRSKVVVIDNYFAFLGSVKFNDETKVFQIWHAGGAIKKFGWEDKKINYRTSKDKKRFQQVYDATDYYITGSREMSQVFQNSYHQSNAKMIEIGVPRTDYYFKEGIIEKNKQLFFSKFPEAKGKTFVLYAPTYREGNLAKINWLKKLPEFPKEYFVIAKFHPHMLKKIRKLSIVTDMRGILLKELLPIVDILITDYSSIPFEYELANPEGKTLYYCFDITQYKKVVGIQDDFFSEHQIEVVYTANELLNNLNKKKHKNGKLINWNEFNDGRATNRLIQLIEEQMKK